jgi:hypothetical protein
MTNDERMQRESSLIATIKRGFPSARKRARTPRTGLAPPRRLPAGYRGDDYALLVMAIKYAGLRGKEVRVIGKNRSTIGEEGRIQ